MSRAVWAIRSRASAAGSPGHRQDPDHRPGQPDRADDSVGLRVAAELQPLLADRPDVDVTEDYWGGLRLMERMIGYDRAIVIDAICTGAAAGNDSPLDDGSMPTQKSASAHDVNLPTALAFGRRAGAHLPADEDVRLIGIEGGRLVNFQRTVYTGGRGGDSPRGPGSAPTTRFHARRTGTMISPELLRRYPYFANVSEEALKEVAMISDEVAAEAGKHAVQRRRPGRHAVHPGRRRSRRPIHAGQRRTADGRHAGGRRSARVVGAGRALSLHGHRHASEGQQADRDQRRRSCGSCARRTTTWATAC